MRWSLFNVDLEAGELLPLRREEEEEALGGAGEREAAHQQRDHHHVGEHRREVGDLAAAAHTLPATQQKYLLFF